MVSDEIRGVDRSFNLSQSSTVTVTCCPIYTWGSGAGQDSSAVAVTLRGVGVLTALELIELNKAVGVADPMRGRISAVNSVFIGVSNELGSFESGLAAALLGPVTAVVAGGIGTIIVVLIVARIWPEIGKLKTLSPEAPVQEAV